MTLLVRCSAQQVAGCDRSVCWRLCCFCYCYCCWIDCSVRLIGAVRHGPFVFPITTDLLSSCSRLSFSFPRSPFLPALLYPPFLFCATVGVCSSWLRSTTCLMWFAEVLIYSPWPLFLSSVDLLSLQPPLTQFNLRLPTARLNSCSFPCSSLEMRRLLLCRSVKSWFTVCCRIPVFHMVFGFCIRTFTQQTCVVS